MIISRHALRLCLFDDPCYICQTSGIHVADVD